MDLDNAQGTPKWTNLTKKYIRPPATYAVEKIPRIALKLLRNWNESQRELGITSDLYRPPTPPDPPIFENGALTPHPLEKLNFYFGRFSINSGEIVIFSRNWTQNVWGSNFSRVERIFTIRQSPKIWGNFSKICIKINIKLKNIEKIWKTMKVFQKIF